MTSQAPPENFDVLIVGAGPTGLMLAHLLALQGIKFRIIDENSARVIESRALAIQARSMELFQSIGLVDRFLSRGTQVSGIIAYMNGKPFLGFEFSGIGRKDTPYPYLFMLSQSITEEILEESLGEFGVKVQRQTSLDRFEQRENKVIAHIKHSDGKDETVEAKYLVGCDGAKSRVRKYSGLTFEGGTYDQEFMLADAKVKWSLPYDRLQAFIGRTGLAVFFPLKGSEYSRIIIVGKNEKGTRSAEQHLTTKEPLQLEELQKKFEETIEHKVVLESPLWMTRYRVHHRSVERMQVGRIFLAGDSAHIHSPAGGQGMNTGLQDAANLAWKLALVIKGKASSDLLETYDFERMPIARKLLSFTDRIFSAGASVNPAIKLAIRFLAPMLAKFVSNIAPRYMFGFVSQLNIHYHPNKTVKEDLSRPRGKELARAGRRAPDAQMKTGGSLFDLMKGYRFNVLVMSKRVISEEARQQFEKKWRAGESLAPEAEIHWISAELSPAAITRYGVDDVLISLVRPDGYIGFQTDRF